MFLGNIGVPIIKQFFEKILINKKTITHAVIEKDFSKPWIEQPIKQLVRWSVVP